MNAPTSSYQSNRGVSCSSNVPSSTCPQTAKHDPSTNNKRLMKYLALLEAQESVTFEHMIRRPQKHTSKHNTMLLTPTTAKLKDAKEKEAELDSSIHKLLKSRRKDLRKAVHLISPSKKASKQQQQAAFATTTPIEDGRRQQQQQQRQAQQQQQHSPPSRRSTIIRAAATTNVPKASASAVAKLPRARLIPAQAAAPGANDSDAGCDDWTCSICQHGPSKSHHTMLTRLPCGHVFHNTCAVLWLGQSCACPTCRFEMETNDAAYERARRDHGMKHRAGLATCSCPRNTSAGTNVCIFANSPGVVAMPCSSSGGRAPQQPTEYDGDDCSEASFEEDDGEAIL